MAAKPEYYITKNGKEAMNPELVTTFAEAQAKLFYPPNTPDKPARGSVVTSAQLRRFYGDVKGLERSWQNSPDERKEEAFLRILPLIKLLKAKSAYAYKRQLVNKSFMDWIWANVDAINDEKDFKAFLLYFEAVVGFCYGNGLNDKS